MNSIIDITKVIAKAYLPEIYLCQFLTLFPPADNSTYQFFVASVLNFRTLSDISYILNILLSRISGPYRRSFCNQSTPWQYFPPLSSLVVDVLISKSPVNHLFHAALRDLFLWVKVNGLLVYNTFLSYNVLLEFYTSEVDRLSFYSSWGLSFYPCV